MSDSSKEREILRVMRKVLGSIIRDTTPPPGHRHTMSDSTIQDVRMCLGLITSREKELADEAGEAMARPYFVDQQPSSVVIPIDAIGKRGKKEKDD